MNRLLRRKPSLTRISSRRGSFLSDQIQISSHIGTGKEKGKHPRLFSAENADGLPRRSSLLFHVGTFIRNKAASLLHKGNTIFRKRGESGDSSGYADIKTLSQPAGPG